MSSRTYHLSDLKTNPKLLDDLLASISQNEEQESKKEPTNKPIVLKKKKLKIRKTKVAQKPIIEEGPIVVSAPVEETEVQNSAEEKSVVVRHDDDESVQKHLAVSRLIREAEGFFNQRSVPFESIEILFSTAYRYADAKNRPLLVRARALTKEAIANQEKRAKLREQAKLKGKQPDQDQLKKFSVVSIKQELGEILKELLVNLATVEKRRQGHGFDDMHREYLTDLSQFDNTGAVVLARANLMVATSERIDLEAVKRSKKHIEVVPIEEPIYVIKNALLVGCDQHALPKKINEQSLEALMALHFRVMARPIPKMLRHKTSNRVWFYVPEYSEIKIKSLTFVDRSMNSEFDAFRELSNSQIGEDDIRFVFLKLGAPESRIAEVIRRWKSSDSHQTRLSIITSEYQAIARMLKSSRLRKLRENFLEENKELITTAEKAKDRIQQIMEEKAEIKQRFSLLASHTGNPDQGLQLSRYNHFDSVFADIERVRVRNEKSSYERQRIREGIFKDKLECRTLKHMVSLNTVESKRLNRVVEASTEELNRRRLKAFEEIN